MIGKKMLCVGLTVLAIASLTACGLKSDSVEESTVLETVTEAAEATQDSTKLEELTPAVPTASFEELEALLGLEDAEAADRFGVSAENWTEDRSTFIGRIYQLSFFGEPIKVFTSYNDERQVVSVSAWITDGTEEVTEEDVQVWVQRICDYAGSEPLFDNTSSEAGSEIWKWKKDDTFVKLFRLENLLTIELQRAVGELQ